MRHQDNIKGWNRWEDMFEATLKEHFNIKPNAHDKSIGVKHQAQVSKSPYSAFSMQALNTFAHYMQLKVEDLSSGGKGGNIWVRTHDSDQDVNRVLLDWKFTYKPGKGWWR